MIVIVGVAGAGKSTLARLLKDLGYDVKEALELALEEDSFLAYDPQRRSLVLDPSCPKGIDILVSTFLPDCSPLYCILVEAPEEIIRERLRRRGYSDEKIEENVEALGTLRMEAEEYCDELLIVDGRNVKASLDEVIEFIERFVKQRSR